MSIKETILADIKDAMKAKEADKVSCLRMVNSALKNKEIEMRPDSLTDKDALSVLKKLVKQRKDSIEQYKNAGRNDLMEKEQQELQFIEVYMPEQMGEDQVRAIVEEVMAETGASSMKDMGAVMKAVQAKTQGQADNKLVSEIVKSKLS